MSEPTEVERPVFVGADVEAAIAEATPLVDPRLSEVDWDAVAAALIAALTQDDRRKYRLAVVLDRRPDALLEEPR